MTKLNNVKEDTAVHVLLAKSKRYQKPDAPTRKRILGLLGAAKFSARAFDLIRTRRPLPPITVENVDGFIDDITLIEVKATKAPIEDENLHGFFFGATDNEYRLAEHLGERYQFAFVVLSPRDGRPAFFVELHLEQVNQRTRTKRIQYQVNFRGKEKA